jgi:hypothetical protein
LIFLKHTLPDGSTTLFVDGVGSVATEISPARIKIDKATGVKMIWMRKNAPIVTMQPQQRESQPTAVDKIRALKALMDDGIISDKEFDAKKAELLAEM